MQISDDRSGAGRAHPGASAKPFSIRLTDDERRLLSERSGGRPLGPFVRDLILAPDARAVRRKPNAPLRDEASLARVLAALGQSRIANNLNQLAKAANIGALPVTRETEADIGTACAAVREMRNALMRALRPSREEP
jgi:hypothetical protein